jgi:hypothetical protein
MHPVSWGIVSAEPVYIGCKSVCEKGKRKVCQFIENQGSTLGNNFYADETMIYFEGRQNRFWYCLDWDTHLIAGVHSGMSVNLIEA